jgi:hypothetical protein
MNLGFRKHMHCGSTDEVYVFCMDIGSIYLASGLACA